MLKSFFPLAFILLWIVPVGWVGLMRSNYPLYPTWIAPLFRVTGVFENAPSRWRIFFIEIQDKESGQWKAIDEKLLFAPTPLGNRTRFQQLMNEIENSNATKQTPMLLEWIAKNLPLKTGYSSSQFKAVRIVHFGVPPETFLTEASLSGVHKVALDANMPRVIVASLNVGP